MFIPLEQRFGPDPDGLSRANDILGEWLSRVHMNWDNPTAMHYAERQLGKPVFGLTSVSDYLANTRLHLLQYELVRELKVYEYPELAAIEAYPTSYQIALLRARLPLASTFDQPTPGFDLGSVQHNVPSMAALNALYILTLSGHYWNDMSHRDNDEPVAVDALGLLEAHRRAAPEIFRELHQRMFRSEDGQSDHPLDVLARIFAPDYWDYGLRIGLFKLPQFAD